MIKKEKAKRLDEGMDRGVEDGGCSTVKVTSGFSEHYNEQGEPEVETRKSSSALMEEGGGCWLEVISNRIYLLLVCSSGSAGL